MKNFFDTDFQLLIEVFAIFTPSSLGKWQGKPTFAVLLEKDKHQFKWTH